MNTPYQKAIALASGHQEQNLGDINLALSEAMEHVAGHATGSSIKNINMLLIGGASLHATGFRKKFSDVDLLIETIELSTRMEQKMLVCKSSKMNVELFYDNKIGSLVDPEMFKRAIPIQNKEIAGVSVSVGLYPPEFFLLVKMEVGREKCQNDIQAMLQGIPLPSLLKAFNSIALHNEKWLMNDMADMLVTDLIMLYLPGKLHGESLSTLRQFCMDLDIEPDKKKELVMMCRHLEHSQKKPTPKASHEGLQP